MNTKTIERIASSMRDYRAAQCVAARVLANDDATRDEIERADELVNNMACQFAAWCATADIEDIAAGIRLARGTT